jgi:hypothetical protein
MTYSELIVCERSGRWAAALRVALHRQAFQSRVDYRLHEVRSLQELARRLEAPRPAIALVEVRPTNLAETLTWLAGACSSHSGIRCVALLDRREFDGHARNSVAVALRAAGAVDIVDSPRHLQSTLFAARRHAEGQCQYLPAGCSEPTFAEWAWGLLPWQPA